MIRRLRDRHRRIIPWIAFLAAAALAIAWFGRQQRNGDIPEVLHLQAEDR